MSQRYFSLGQFVKVSENNDNEGYDSFRGKKLQIVHVARNKGEHPGYDEVMKGEPLYDLMDVETGETIGLSLYFYELKKW